MGGPGLFPADRRNGGSCPPVRPPRRRAARSCLHRQGGGGADRPDPPQAIQAELEDPVRAHGRRTIAVRLPERVAVMSAATKTVGVIGGMGPAATLDFFDRILKRTKAVRDEDHLRLII